MKQRFLTGLAVFALTLPCAPNSLRGQNSSPSPAPPNAAIVSVDHPETFDPAAATRAWLDTVSPEKRAKSDAYFEGGYWLLLWDYLAGAIVALFFLQSRLSAGIRNRLEASTRFKSLEAAGYAIIYSLIAYLISFPLTVYEQYFREHQYGLATQTFGPWLGEQLMILFVNVLAFALVLMALYAVFRAAPRHWWIWGAGLAVFFLMLAAMVAPVFIAPLLNTYKPLTDPKLRDPILTLARANEIPVDQVFEFDASRQTTRVSANVSGFLGTTRISLNDNLLKQCSLPEIRHVMGHEMGHFVLNHTVKLISAFAFFILAGFFFARSAFVWAVTRWGQRWDVRGIADPAGFPLLVLIFTTFGFLSTPLINTTIRMSEREADAFGLNTAREPDGFAQSALKLGSYRKLNPGPIEEVIFYDHPSGRARIRMAMDWKGAQLPAGGVTGK